MRYLLVFLLLIGCSSTNPSEIITESAKNELISIKDTVDLIEDQTKDECKTESFVANVKAIKNQINSIGTQIDALNSTCIIEKKELETKITNREIIILSLAIFIIVYLYFRLKGKLL